jgi:hypothetical protein
MAGAAHGHTGPAVHGGPRQLVGACVTRALGSASPATSVANTVLERVRRRWLGGTWARRRRCTRWTVRADRWLRGRPRRRLGDFTPRDGDASVSPQRGDGSFGWWSGCDETASTAWHG